MAGFEAEELGGICSVPGVETLVLTSLQNCLTQAMEGVALVSHNFIPAAAWPSTATLLGACQG